MTAIRFADEATVQQYPYPVVGPADWQPTDSGWTTTIEASTGELGKVPANHIIVPSLSVLASHPNSVTCTLVTSKKRYTLPDVPNTQSAAKRSADSGDSRVRMLIDCFHTLKPINAPKIEIAYHGKEKPERYLLTITTRPINIEAPKWPGHESVHTILPPTHSQMLENPRHASRICSPVSAGMVVVHHLGHIHWEKFIGSCYDPVTRMYGIWPLAIQAASALGCLGAVEVIDDWSCVIECLRANLPIVASIQFKSGELPGAPMDSSGGHLVVVHGLEDNQVLVNDPAAPFHGSVNRRYSLEAFSRAWFCHRGAAYILIP